MKKHIVIFSLAVVTLFVALNSIMFLCALKSNQIEIRSKKAKLLNKSHFIDITNEFLYKNTKQITWIEDDELKIGDNYFDVLKIEKLSNNKNRVYIYCDIREKSINLALQHEQGVKTNPSKKNKNNLVTDFMKLKTYTKHYSNQIHQQAIDLHFISLKNETKDGFCSLINQPPRFIIN